MLKTNVDINSTKLNSFNTRKKSTNSQKGGKRVQFDLHDY